MITKTETATETATEVAVSSEAPPAGAHLAAVQLMLVEFSTEVEKAILEELGAFKSEAENALAVLEAVRTFEVADEATEQVAGKYMLAIHAKATALESMRTAITKPTLSFKRGIDNLFKDPKKAYDAAKDELSRKLGAFRVARQQKLDAQLAAARAQAQTPEEHRQIIVSSTTEATKVAGTREYVSYEIQIEDAAVVPREFCMPSESKLKAEAERQAALGNAPAIAGVKITKVVKVGPTGRLF